MDAPYSHDIFSDIFDKLSDPVKAEFKDRFNKTLAGRDMTYVKILEMDFKLSIHRDLESNLRDWSGVFAGLRYVYEFTAKAKQQKTMMFFPEIRTVVTQMIYSHEPTWRN
jgi:hypothetical protein